MSVIEYKKHFGEHTALGPQGVVMLNKVQHPLRDAPLNELAQGQFRQLISQCRKSMPTLAGIFAGTTQSKALVIANLASECACPVVMITKDFFQHCDIGDLPRLFAELANHSAILFFEQGDDWLKDDISHHDNHIDKDALLKLVTLHQGTTLFSLNEASVIADMKIRSPYFIEITTP